MCGLLNQINITYWVRPIWLQKCQPPWNTIVCDVIYLRYLWARYSLCYIFLNNICFAEFVEKCTEVFKHTSILIYLCKLVCNQIGADEHSDHHLLVRHLCIKFSYLKRKQLLPANLWYQSSKVKNLQHVWNSIYFKE